MGLGTRGPSRVCRIWSRHTSQGRRSKLNGKDATKDTPRHEAKFHVYQASRPAYSQLSITSRALRHYCALQGQTFFRSELSLGPYVAEITDSSGFSQVVTSCGMKLKRNL